MFLIIFLGFFHRTPEPVSILLQSQNEQECILKILIEIRKLEIENSSSSRPFCG